jgi:small-conductance mechanosensitive channel/CRP-like cAMP-binding protein
VIEGHAWRSIMNMIDRQILFGAGIILLDFLAWRFVRYKHQHSRAFVRALLFSLLCYVLWSLDISPFRPPAKDASAPRHLLMTLLELVWWFQAALLSASTLGTVILRSDPQRERLLYDVLRAAAFLVATIAAVAYVLQLPVGGLLATSGAVAVIFGLAVQSTLSDAFSGIVLNATQPFQPGDTVIIGTVEGEVIESNWRATTLLNNEGCLVVVPHSTAAKADIINQSRPAHFHGMKVMFRVSPGVRPAVVIAALSDALAATHGVLEEPRPGVNAQIVRRHHVEYEVVFFVATRAARSPTRNELIDQAYRHLGARGIDLEQADNDAASSGSPEWLLRGVDMFDSLSGEELSRLCGALVREEHSPGQTIYQAGGATSEVPKALYIVASGVAIVWAKLAGREVEMGRLAPGEAMGRVGVLTGFSNDVRLEALTRVVTYRLPREALTPVLQSNPEVGQRMIDWLMAYRSRAAATLDAIPDHVGGKTGLAARLIEGMRRLHGMLH